ncbi:CPBP family glutamic-type intramembrane protease [Furfurilactobacillus curtus]|uniref:CAAX prenyl protease 2/Lysostaphin resistance protein A-like domain-containing protein n=1 Tax=Furfurilactobacillus curtus TaxID=1746200 RepID=A0ABQ5JQC4_9LACO
MKNGILFEKKRETRGFPLIDYDRGASTKHLVILLIVTILASLMLVFADPIKNVWLNFIFENIVPFIIFIIAFNTLSGSKISQLFRRLTWRDLGFGLVMLIAGTIYSNVAVTLLKELHYQAVADSTTSVLLHTAKDVILEKFTVLEIGDVLETFSEEFLALFSFLIVAALIQRHTQLSRNKALVISWIISMFIFGAMHFKAYDFHFLEMFFAVGVSRFFDTGVYIRTKNIFITFLSHFLFDSFGFLAVTLRVLTGL